MQGDPASPMIFNIVVDVMVREVLDVVCGPQEAQHGLGWATVESNLIFYAKDSMISGWDNELVQDAISVTVEIFRRMGLEKSFNKTKAMVCTPGFIWGEWGEHA